MKTHLVLYENGEPIGVGRSPGVKITAAFLGVGFVIVDREEYQRAAKIIRQKDYQTIARAIPKGASDEN